MIYANGTIKTASILRLHSLAAFVQTLHAAAQPLERVLWEDGTESGILQDVDDDGASFYTIGYVQPDGVYAEIEDGTYGQLQGWRFYVSS